MISFDKYRDREGFPLTSTQEPLWRKCWESAQDAIYSAGPYSSGVLEDGAAILVDGVMLTIEQIVMLLNGYNARVGKLKADNLDLEQRLVTQAATINALQNQLREQQEKMDELRAKTSVTMGVGNGDGQLFVHGDYDSIKAAQAIVMERDKLLAAGFSEKMVYWKVAAHRFLSEDGSAATDWEDGDVDVSKRFPDLCPRIGAIQFAYIPTEIIQKIGEDYGTEPQS